MRGFTLDNRFNYRRDGLPISAETSIPLDNKERVEILKGTSGLQAGTSAPGGLVNYVVKRPTQKNLRDVKLELSGNGSALAAIDFGGRLGDTRDFGYRLNLAHENLQPRTRNTDGQRSLAALATDSGLPPPVSFQDPRASLAPLVVTQHALMGDITYQNAGAMLFGLKPLPGYL